MRYARNGFLILSLLGALSFTPAPSYATLPAPTAPTSFACRPLGPTFMASSPGAASPLGILTASNQVALLFELDATSPAVDVYIAAQLPDQSLWLLNSVGQWLSYPASVVAFRTQLSSAVVLNTLTQNLLTAPIANLSPGTYQVYTIVVPTGTDPKIFQWGVSPYYLWCFTQVVAPTNTPPPTAPAPTVSLAATPNSITSGGSSTMDWSSTNATSCDASGAWSGAKATSGSESTGVLTQNTSFTLTCTGTGGSANQTVSVSVGVTPPPAPTVNLSATPNSIASGESSTLNWSSTNATSCDTTGAWSGAKATSGSESTGALTQNRSYTLTCTGTGGSASQSTTVTVSALPPPPPNPGGSLTVGYNAATQTVTAATVVLDLAMPAAGNYPAWVSRPPYPGMVRAATHEVLPGGFFGRGFSRFTPGSVIDNNRGEHYCGIGQIHGFSNVGDSSRMVVGQLVRFGTTFFSDMASVNAIYGDIKDIVLINDSCQVNAPNCRPMMNTKGSSPNVGATRVMGACQGTVCNTKNDISQPYDYFNEGGHQPDIDRYRGQWLWIEFQFNSNVPRTRTRVWSADGVFQGAEIIAPWASPGRVTTLDIIGFVNSIPTPGAQPYYDLERIEFRVGTDANITPPNGFPGSAR